MIGIDIFVVVFTFLIQMIQIQEKVR